MESSTKPKNYAHSQPNVGESNLEIVSFAYTYAEVMITAGVELAMCGTTRHTQITIKRQLLQTVIDQGIHKNDPEVDNYGGKL
jgi:hypothetical protein